MVLSRNYKPGNNGSRGHRNDHTRCRMHCSRADAVVVQKLQRPLRIRTGQVGHQCITRQYHTIPQYYATIPHNTTVPGLARLGIKVNGRVAPQLLCPSLQALETMPSQHAFATKIHAQQSKMLLNDRHLPREDQAFMPIVPNFGQGCGSRVPPPSNS